MNRTESPRYPLLEAFLAIRDIALQPTYSTRSLALLFDVTPRAILNRVSSGQLIPRDLPGRAKFLPKDIEEFLAASRKKGS